MYLQTERKPRKRSTAPSHELPHDQGSTTSSASTLKPRPVKPQPIDPLPLIPPPHRPGHLVHEASTGAVRVQFPATETNSDTQAIEHRLNKRLRASARSGDAEAHRRACQAADELVEILCLMKLSTEQCLSLVKSKALWASFLQPSQAPVFVVKAASEPEATQAAELRLAEPVNRRVVAALITAMIQGAMDGSAASLLQACPRERDRRVVLKHLLTQPGGVLKRLRAPKAIAVFELALQGLMTSTNSRGRLRYAALQPQVDKLLTRWHRQAAPPSASPIEALLSFGGREDLGSARGGELIDAVLAHLQAITTVQAARPFIQMLTTGLVTLQTITDQRAHAEQGLGAAALARQRLLPAMVKHFGALVSGQGEAHNADWAALAQWVWATGAVLSLVPGNGASVEPGDRSTPHAALLSFLHQTTALLPATLSLLCEPTLLSARQQRPPPKPGFFRPEAFKLSDVKTLWALCPLATRQAVLKLPLPQLWPMDIPTLAIDQFFAEHELSQEQRAAQLVALLDAGTALSSLPGLLVDALGTATLSQILIERPPQHKDAWWLVHALTGLVERMRNTGQPHRPRALPNLLSLLRRITLEAKGLEHMHLWDVWTGFVIECARLPQLEAQDWVLVGTYLPLGPKAQAAQLQIQRLSQDTSGSFMVHLLQGWLAQRFADACNPIPQISSEPLVPTFQPVWDITKGLLASLSSAERQALGEELPVVLETLRLRNDELFKKK